MTNEERLKRYALHHNILGYVVASLKGEFKRLAEARSMMPISEVAATLPGEETMMLLSGIRMFNDQLYDNAKKMQRLLKLVKKDTPQLHEMVENIAKTVKYDFEWTGKILSSPYVQNVAIMPEPEGKQ